MPSRGRRILSRLWRHFRRFLKWSGLTLIVLVLLVFLIVALPFTRGALLRTALDQAHRFLPGELVYDQAHWPGLGQIEFEGLVWLATESDSLLAVAPGDTLAAVQELRLDINLQALREKDLVVRDVALQAGPVRVPAIVGLFAITSPETLQTSSTEPDSSKIFLRAGALPMVPSMEIQAARFQVHDILVNESLHLDSAQFSATVQMLAENEPRVHLGQGRLKGSLQAEEIIWLEVDSLALDVVGNGRDSTFVIEKMHLRIPEAGTPEMLETWRNSPSVELGLTGSGHWIGAGLSTALKLDCLLPGPEHLRSILPDEFPQHLQGALQGWLEVEASIADLKNPDPKAQLRWDFSPTPWVERWYLAGGLEAGRVTVDTLEVALEGLSLEASGWVDTLAVDLQLNSALAESELLQYLSSDSIGELEAGYDLKATVQGQWPLPDLNLDLSAFAKTPDLTVPSLEVHLESQRRLFEAAVWADQGLQFGATQIDSIKLNWQGDASQTDSLAHRFDLGVWAPRGRMALGGWGLVDSLRTIHLDSLVVVGLDSTMRTHQPATIVHGPGPGDIEISDFRLSGGLGEVAVALRRNASGLDLHLESDLMLREDFLMTVAPSEIWSRDGGADVSINADVRLQGKADGPEFEGRAGAALLPHRDDPDLGVDLSFYLVQGDSSGLGADLLVRTDDVALVQGTFRWPGHPDLTTGRWVPDATRGLELKFPEQVVNLERLNTVMPPDILVHGDLGLRMELIETHADSSKTAEGAQLLSNAVIDGSLSVPQLDVELPNRSRISLKIATQIEGTLVEPKLTGEVTVRSGFFRLAEIPQTLLPVEGTSLLWEAMSDSTETVYHGPARPQEQGPALGQSAPMAIPDLDLKVNIPGNLVINGYGMNAELEGELQVTRGYDEEGLAMPVLRGRAGVRQGSLKFMNRIFNVVRADLRFDGDAPPNPHLNILMTADVSSYLVHLEVTGFADEPQVKLRSEPEMNEADIIAVLLFGQPANDLDNDQRGRAREENDPGAQLRENLAAMAVMFGGAGITNQVSNTLGVDMVEMGSGSEGDSTLMVGKFLTQKILLKYNQSLEKSGTYFMTLEYTLSKYFKLLSTYGQGEEKSGLELKWTKRY